MMSHALTLSGLRRIFAERLTAPALLVTAGRVGVLTDAQGLKSGQIRWGGGAGSTHWVSINA